MFHQNLAPIGGSLLLSFIVAALPIATVLVMLGILRRPAWQASLGGLIAGLVISILFWHMPVFLAVDSTLNGMVFALWPVMWIAVNALLLYNIAVESGRFDAFRQWILDNLPADRRVVLIVVGFCFGALLEGIAGFGSTIAISSSLLILVGWEPLEAVTYSLIFDTAPVAYGALGIPVTVLGAITHLPAEQLGAMIGRQLPFLAFLLPFYVMGVFGGRRSIAALWPLLLTAGGSFALIQFVVSNYFDYRLTDVFASLGSLIITVLFLRVWRPKPDPHFAANINLHPAAVSLSAAAAPRLSPWQGWIPWIVVSVVVIAWTQLGLSAIGRRAISWPGLDKAVYITLYHKPYAAIWTFEPLATGTAILFAAIFTALLFRVSPRRFVACAVTTWRQVRVAVMTVSVIMGLAFLMNFSGMTYTLGDGVSHLGLFFALASAFLGWVAVALSGSDTSGNALFGNLQVVAAHQLGLDPLLFAATGSSGGVLGKMISPQNISTGVSVTPLKGQEGLVFSKTFKHSIILTTLLGIIAVLQQFVFHWMVPH
nr:L-lactate permease [uncultured Lichenicoccus sp.]